MARAKSAQGSGETVELQAQLTEEEQAAIDLDEANEVEGGDLFAALDEMRGTAGVNFIVVRVFPSTPDKAGYVGSLTPAEFSLERLTERYGPGIYRVRVRGPKGWLKGGGTIKIASGVEAPARSTDGSNIDAIAKLIQSMEEQRRAQTAEATARRDKLIELAIPGLLTIIASILGKNNAPDLTGLVAALKPSPGPSLTDLTTSLASLKSLTTPPAEGDSKLDMILKVMEFAKTMSGGGDADKGESNWIDVIRDLLKEGPAMVKPVLEAIQNNQGQHVVPPMMVSPMPSSVPTGLPSGAASSAASSHTLATPENSTPSEGHDMLTLFMPMIRAQLAKLLTWAREKRRVELYAEVLLEELPATVHQYVTPQQALEYLKHPHWFEIVSAPNMEPALQPHRDWLDAMRKELISILEEQLRGEPTSDENESGEVAS